MSAALKLALTAGMKFRPDTFPRIVADFRAYRWIGASDEWVYSVAVRDGHPSAAVAFEAWKGRLPIIMTDVRPSSSHGGAGSELAACRVHVGCEFEWRGERVECTSFGKDGAASCCSYRPRPKTGYAPRKILHRYVITRDAVLQERKDKAERAAAVAWFVWLKDAGHVGDSYVKSVLGVKTMKAFAAMPVEKLRRAVKKTEAHTKQFIRDHKPKVDHEADL